MAKIPVILEAGRADGKLIKTNSVYDDNQEKFLSDKIEEIDNNHNTLNDTVSTLTDTVNNNELDIETKLDEEKTRATETENNLREAINNITKVNENATTANIVTINTIPNSSASNVQQALTELFNKDEEINNNIITERNRAEAAEQANKQSIEAIIVNNEEQEQKLSKLKKEVNVILSGSSYIDLLSESFTNYKTLNNWGEVIDSKNVRLYVSEDIKLQNYIGKKISIGADWEFSDYIIYVILSDSGSLIIRTSISENTEINNIPKNADVLRIAVLAKLKTSIITDLQNSQKSIFVRYIDETDSYEVVKDNAALSKSILKGIEDGSIYPESSIEASKTKMVDIKKSTNLLDLSKIKDGYYLSTSGEEYAHETYFYLTDYLDVNEGDTISLQYTDIDGERKKGSLRFCTAYDENKNCLASKSGTSISDYQVPTSVKYVRVTAYRTFLDKEFLSIVKTSNIIPYEEYGIVIKLKEELIPESYINIKEEVINIKEAVSNIKEESNYNLLKPLIINMMCIGDSLTQGSYYGTTDGHSVGEAIAENYPYYLSRLNNWNVNNMGVSGYSAIDWWNSYKNPLSATTDVREKFENVNFAEHDFYILWLGSNTRVYLGSGQTITYTDSTTNEQVTITTGKKDYQVVWNHQNNLCRLYYSSEKKYLERGWSYANGYIEDPRGNRYVGIINDMTDSLEYDVIGKDNYEEYGSQEYGASATACYCKIISKIIADNYKAKIVLGTVFFGNKETNDYINHVIRKIALLYPDNILGVVDNDIELCHDPLNHIPSNNVHFNKIGNLRLAQHWSDEILKLISNNMDDFEHILIRE